MLDLSEDFGDEPLASEQLTAVAPDLGLEPESSARDVTEQLLSSTAQPTTGVPASIQTLGATTRSLET